MFQKLSVKIFVLIISIGLIPLLGYGIYSIDKAEQTSVTTVINANKKIGSEVSKRIYQYLNNAEMILIALAENMNRVGLNTLQKQQIIRNYSINFDEFNRLKIYGKDKSLIMSSEISSEDTNEFFEEGFSKAARGELFMSSVYMATDLIPAISYYLPIKYLDKVEAVLMAEIDLLHLWQLVERLKIGERGYLSVLTKKGQVFASGSGDLKTRAIQMEEYPDLQKVRLGFEGSYERCDSIECYLAVATQIKEPFGWLVVVEQPVSEAYALSRLMRSQLVMIIIFVLIVVLIIGWVLAKYEIINPIDLLMMRIRDISQGQLEGRVDIKNKGEFTELADTINHMSEDIIEYQNTLVIKEKEALLGKIASGLAHDLRHPITSVENYTRLLLENPRNPENQKMFVQTLNNEFGKIHTFLLNLHDLSVDASFSPIHESVTLIIDEVLRSVAPELSDKGIYVDAVYDDKAVIELDLFSFQRIVTNLIRNAIEAMPDGGQLTIAVKLVQSIPQDPEHSYVRIQISDTGCGIPKDKLETLFTNFMTTKRGGLGLGLAVVSKLIRQHKGFVTVQSELEQGTDFILHFPAICSGDLKEGGDG